MRVAGYGPQRGSSALAEEGEEHDGDEELEREVRRPLVEEVHEDHVEHAEVHQRLEERPEVAEHRSRVLELEVAQRQLAHQVPLAARLAPPGRGGRTSHDLRAHRHRGRRSWRLVTSAGLTGPEGKGGPG